MKTTCGETRTHGASSFVCIRTPHSGDQSDRHVFVKPGGAA